MLLKLTLEYDGTGFHGGAAQPGLRTVEGDLRSALARCFPSFEGLAVAGRTDAGVHALAQVASVEVDGGSLPPRAASAPNRLPAGAPALGAPGARGGSRPRLSARSRSYRYRLFRRASPSPFEARRSWWFPRP